MEFRQTYYWLGALRGALLVALLVGIDGNPQAAEPPSTQAEVKLARELAEVSSFEEAERLLKAIRFK